MSTKTATNPVLRKPTIVLSISQLLSWGALYYAFAVVTPAARAEAGWSTVELSGAFSVGLLVSGVAAPGVGRALERRGPRTVMTVGSLVGGFGMATWAAAGSLGQLYAAWLLIGMSMAAVLYEPAVATLMRVGAGESRRAIVAVTTAGGLASTVFAPLSHLLTEMFGWRSTVALVGVTVALITTGLHSQLPRRLPAPSKLSSTRAPAVLKTREFRWVRRALVSQQIAHVASTAFLVSFLLERGATGREATTALAALGVGKLGGRLVLGGALQSAAPSQVAAVANAAQFVLLAAIATVPPAAVIYILAVLAGAGSGMTTVLRPLITVDLAGIEHYTAVSARLQRASVFGRAAAPLAFGFATQIVGWGIAWTLVISAFLVSARLFHLLGIGPGKQ